MFSVDAEWCLKDGTHLPASMLVLGDFNNRHHMQAPNPFFLQCYFTYERTVFGLLRVCKALVELYNSFTDEVFEQDNVWQKIGKFHKSQNKYVQCISMEYM